MRKPKRQPTRAKPPLSTTPSRRIPVAQLEGFTKSWRLELDELFSGIQSKGLTCAADVQERMLVFCREVARANQVLGLVSKNDVPHLIAKHIGPSLAVALVEPPVDRSRWVDVGSGGGFPGMVLKICFPDSHIDLLDSSYKKTVFLSATREKLGFADMNIYNVRLDSSARAGGPGDDDLTQLCPVSGRSAAGPSRTERTIATLVAARYEVILMRAVADLSRSIKWVSAIAPPGARLVTFKGPAWPSELRTADEQIRGHGWRFLEATRIPWSQGTLLRFKRSS